MTDAAVLTRDGRHKSEAVALGPKTLCTSGGRGCRKRRGALRESMSLSPAALFLTH